MPRDPSATAMLRHSFAACAAAAVLAACATPAERYDRRAADAGFAAVELPGDAFRHRAYVADLHHGDTLHVYVEHDGTPWIDERVVASDPTPRTPLALELMARDSGPRMFLGRPCYFGYGGDAGCSALLWTHRRYAPEVVASMTAALRGVVAAHGFRRVVLVGYSGGGTLAWLMARDVPQAVAVVTVAANLDVDGWAALHGYTPLAGSLNPARLPPLPAAIAQVNLAGGRDTNVPPAIAAAFGASHAGAKLVVIDDFDHRCCWTQRWPQLLHSAGPWGVVQADATSDAWQRGELQPAAISRAGVFAAD